MNKIFEYITASYQEIRDRVSYPTVDRLEVLFLQFYKSLIVSIFVVGVLSFSSGRIIDYIMQKV